MFQTELDEPSAGAFVLQQFAVPLIPVIWIAAASMLVPSPYAWTEPAKFARVVLLGFREISPWGVGLVRSYLVARRSPSSTETGRWIWAIPTTLLVALVVYDLIQIGGRDLHDLILGPDNVLALVTTLPVWSAISYSLGMTFIRRNFVRGVSQVQ